FQGRAEVGPRALGQRSILADPRNADMRDYINSEIKHREPWRPLGPSLLAESCAAYLEKPGPSEYMIVAYQATPLAWETIPATIHVDGTVRPQAVSEATLPRYARLIKAFAALTDVPALLNTSFNLENEPIVCTPADAVRTFCSSSLDVLAIGNFLVPKPRKERAI
ncbi:MAG: carbamoyltransferase C-terminal domain-containing protein, partial [Ktedonobacterales bacterium]